MKNPLRLLAGSLLAALSVVAAPAQLDWSEPSYGGKTTSEWLDEYGASPGAYKPSLQADDALRHFGANAAPFLLELLYATNYTGKGQPIPAVTPPASWEHWKAFLGFQVLGPLGKAAIPELTKLAHKPDATGRYSNLLGMKNMTLVANVADVSSTYGAVDDPRRNRGGAMLFIEPFLLDGDIAARSLAAIGADGVPPLVELLADPSPSLRVRAVQALGLAGGAAEQAVPALIKTMNDPNLDVRIGATDALGGIGRQPDLAIPALIKALTDPAEGVDYYAAVSLGEFRQQATNAIPALLLDFRSPDYRNRDSAALALDKISPETCAREVIPVLLRDIKAAPVGGYRNGSAVSANMSLITLGQMQDQIDLVIPPLVEVIADTNFNQMDRMNAIGMLGGFGPAAKSALPKLSSLTNDPDPEVRAQAIRSLQQIDPGPTPPR